MSARTHCPCSLPLTDDERTTGLCTSCEAGAGAEQADPSLAVDPSRSTPDAVDVPALLAQARQGREDAERLRAGHELIADERARQVSGEGWTPAHDDAHDTGEVARAAACYLHTVAGAPASAPDWPWDRTSWKPSGGAIRNLVKAGALIAAEIDRLQRAATPSPSPEGA